MEAIQVWATSENVQKYVVHPLCPDQKFPDDISQPVTWPYDSFTMTRIRDGDVSIGQQQEE